MTNDFFIENGGLHHRGQWPKTLKGSLMLSVRKWQVIVKEIERTKELLFDGNSDTCALCHWAESKHAAYSCRDCPIAEKTGQTNCIGTPYIKYHEIIYDEAGNYQEALKVAKAELKFLQKLYSKLYPKR